MCFISLALTSSIGTYHLLNAYDREGVELRTVNKGATTLRGRGTGGIQPRESLLNDDARASSKTRPKLCICTPHWTISHPVVSARALQTFSPLYAVLTYHPPHSHLHWLSVVTTTTKEKGARVFFIPLPLIPYVRDVTALTARPGCHTNRRHRRQCELCRKLPGSVERNRFVNITLAQVIEAPLHNRCLVLI